MNLNKAKLVTGWMRIPELEWLASVARDLHRIIEVGSYQGRSTRAMLDNSEAHLWCVDSWADTVGSPEAYEAFLKNIQDKKGQVTILHMRSDQAAKLLIAEYGPESFDMVFIDGGHSYKVVKADILTYTTLVRVGGIVCGHDYATPKFKGISRAVDELMGEFNLVSSIWWRVKS